MALFNNYLYHGLNGFLDSTDFISEDRSMQSIRAIL